MKKIAPARLPESPWPRSVAAPGKKTAGKTQGKMEGKWTCRKNIGKTTISKIIGNYYHIYIYRELYRKHREKCSIENMFLIEIMDNLQGNTQNILKHDGKTIGTNHETSGETVGNSSPILCNPDEM